MVKQTVQLGLQRKVKFPSLSPSPGPLPLPRGGSVFFKWSQFGTLFFILNISQRYFLIPFHGCSVFHWVRHLIYPTTPLSMGLYAVFNIFPSQRKHQLTTMSIVVSHMQIFPEDKFLGVEQLHRKICVYFSTIFL